MTYTINQTNTTAAPITLGTYISPNAGSGLVYTTGNTSPYWSDVMSISTGNITTPSALQVNGDANFEGDLKLKGKSLNESLTKIEERLAILHPNEKLEAKWEKLRDLRKQYLELEADISEKEKIIEILKR